MLVIYVGCFVKNRACRKLRPAFNFARVVDTPAPTIPHQPRLPRVAITDIGPVLCGEPFGIADIRRLAIGSGLSIGTVHESGSFALKVDRCRPLEYLGGES